MSTIIKYGSNGNWLNYNGYVLNANATVIPPLSYRFRFESPQTAASLSGVGSHGSWTRLTDYVWDFTCDERYAWNRNFHYNESGQLPACHLVGTSTTAMDVIHQAFYNQDNLKSVYISEAAVTEAFLGCTGITSFRMGNFAGGDTQLSLNSAETIEFGIFNGQYIIATSCTSLHIGTLPGTNYNQQNFSVVGSPYNPCSIVVDSMPNAVSIATICQGGDGIASVYLGETSSLQNCRNAFANCSNLTQVHIDDTSNVTSTNQMFLGCSALPTCPTFDLSSCSNMSYMFYECTSLTACPDFTVDNGLLGPSGYTSVQFMYARCTGLTSGAFDWYYKLTGDRNAYVDAYGHLPPDPYYDGPFNPNDRTDMFEYADSTETGWQYIPDDWK